MPKKSAQKIIIPKGTINPDEDTLIEIPRGLQEQPIVVAKTGFQERSISIQRSARNVDFGGNKYTVAENRSKIEVVKEKNDESFNPKLHSTARTDLDNKTFRDVTLSSRYDEMQKAKRELQETGFLNVANQPQNNCIPKHVTNEIDEVYAKSLCSLPSTSCDKSVQFKSSTLSTDKNSGKCATKSKNSFDLSSYEEDPSLFKSSSKKKHFNKSTSSFRSRGSETSPKRDSCSNISTRSRASLTSPKSGSYSSESTSSSSSQSFENAERRGSLSESKRADRHSVTKGCSKENHSRRKRSTKYQTSCSQTEPLTQELMPPRGKSKRTGKQCNMADSPIEQKDPYNSIERSLEDKDKLNKFYKRRRSEIDDIYVEQLKRQFEEAKRKLEDALMLASVSLKQLSNNKKYSERRVSKTSSRAALVCDSVPELDISFVPQKAQSSFLDAPVTSHGCRSCPISNQDGAMWSKVDPSPSKSNEFDTSKHSAGQLRNCSTISNATLPTSKANSSHLASANSKNTQASLESWERVELDNFKPGSSKCLACCEPQRSSSIRFVKDPRCNISDSESFLGNTSTFLS